MSILTGTPDGTFPPGPDQPSPGGGHASPGQLFKQVPFSISLAITPNRQFGREGQFLRVTLSIFAVAGNVHFFCRIIALGETNS